MVCIVAEYTGYDIFSVVLVRIWIIVYDAIESAQEGVGRCSKQEEP